MFMRVFITVTILASCVNAEEQKPMSWSELTEQFECPAWYRDAKFGIWAHWGAQSKPARGGGWYARHMYYSKDRGMPRHEHFGKEAYEYHKKTYGHPSEQGFKDVIHEWKAEKLDTDALLKYFKQCGAKYFVALANHHDHFDNFDSTYHSWNSVNVGPKRDIIGEFAASARKYDMPFGVSSHDERFLEWWLSAFGADKSGPRKGIPYDGHMTKADGKGKWWEGLDPAELYGLPPKKRNPEWIRSVKENWKLRQTELVQKYDPDMLWFDGHGFPYGDYGKDVCTTFYNQSLLKHGKINAVAVGKIENEPATITDIETGVAPRILPRTWQSIISIGEDWFYKEDRHIHNARTIIEMLSDVISKNGNLLVNIDLLPDGTIPPVTRRVFDDVGAWVNLHAEAIYASRHWIIHGDNLHSEKGVKRNRSKIGQRTMNSPPYASDEVRFTTKGSTRYVFVLNPKAGPIKLPALGLTSPYQPGEIKSVRMIGSTQTITFSQEADALTLTVPADRPTKYTTVFKLVGKTINAEHPNDALKKAEKSE